MADLTAGSRQANADPTSSELSWLRTDLSNLRTLLAWSRTAVSLIGFGFTIYNFYSGFFEEVGNERIDAAARNLGLALVATGITAVVIAVWNFWSINRYLEELPIALFLSHSMRRRWVYGYIIACTLIAIGLVTLLFMLRVI